MKHRYRHIVDRLDRLAGVATEVLAEAVLRGGACITAVTRGDPPELTGFEQADTELADRICAGCLLQEECLELEMRWGGPNTVGVFGALPERERRELYPHWRFRRTRGGDGR